MFNILTFQSYYCSYSGNGLSDTAIDHLQQFDLLPGQFGILKLGISEFKYSGMLCVGASHWTCSYFKDYRLHVLF